MTMKRGDDGLTREERKRRLLGESYEEVEQKAERIANEDWDSFLLHIGAAGSHIEAMVDILTPMMIIKGIPEKITLLERIQADLKKLAAPLGGTHG
jgi:hypothetical protein